MASSPGHGEQSRAWQAVQGAAMKSRAAGSAALTKVSDGLSWSLGRARQVEGDAAIIGSLVFTGRTR